MEVLRLKRSQRGVESEDVDEEALRRILARLRVRTGHDFSKYKRSTVLRRIIRRMQVNRVDSLTGYQQVMREKADEAQLLQNDLLISVTAFFRDSESFEALQKIALPALFKHQREEEQEPIRIWVAGCATGEEAYTLAILLFEATVHHGLRPTIQVFATDLDARALAVAREGRYPASIETDVNQERLERFFSREGDSYRVRQEVRDVVLFAAHDLLKDPPFSHVDLITCRNLLIYLERELQEQACGTFHYALRPGGLLMLGNSESAEQPPGLFRALDRGARIYQSTSAAIDKPRSVPSLPALPRLQAPRIQIARAVSPTAALSEATIHRRAIEKIAPPSVLVDATHRVLHMSETAGRYMQPAGGLLSADIVDLARPELRFELRSALNRLFERREGSLSLPIMVRFNGTAHRVHLLIKAPVADEPLRNAVVMFIEGDPLAEAHRATQDGNAEAVQRLAQELELTQSRLRTVREESDGANEELRAANEELQSINEELQTVNTELKAKLDSISRAHSDLQNLMAATDFGTLFLDTRLRIKRFTDRVPVRSLRTQSSHAGLRFR
jgi:two-component system CheB/CheR fusion protein